ncbi:MAG TPA: pantoate kinase [Methanocella sp.]|uniref:pantoate kinase n=1 Tax=Methanocella sp. TaxID=2052833 RepID=UPI002B90F59C|nr:pantoate kinase [Methanocella sp.]HTY90239.1 pantoate kinase [Methanocella sp.]
MIGKAFAPSHITGFFYAHDDPDPLKAGSCGCGFTLEGGVSTTAWPSNTAEVYVDGVPSDAPTTRTVIELLADKPVHVESDLDMPVGGGFGASGAGAFSTALAINSALGLGKTYNELAYAAHVAEVKNRTGLGDVAGMTLGGIVIRTRPGTPFTLDRIPIDARDVYCVHFGPISTKSVLSDPKEKALINVAGKKCLKELLKAPTFDHFMRLSRKFSVDTGLISKKALDAIETVEAFDGMASMAMLGDTVFSTTPEGLSSFGTVIKSRISLEPARLLK